MKEQFMEAFKFKETYEAVGGVFALLVGDSMITSSNATIKDVGVFLIANGFYSIANVTRSAIQNQRDNKIYKNQFYKIGQELRHLESEGFPVEETLITFENQQCKLNEKNNIL